MTCDRCSNLEARLDRTEAILERLLAGQADGLLVAALRRSLGGEWVAASEIWRLAQAWEAAARIEGDPRPELAEALQAAGIVSVHGLGRWLARHEGHGVERGPRTSDGALWRVP